MQRTKRRITCELVIGDERHSAIVRDVSPAGLFVQTRARPKPDTVVELVFAASADRPEIRVEAGVARERSIPSGLQSEVPGGVGLEVLDPSPEFRDLIAAHESPAATEGAASSGLPSSPGVRTFRVRLMERGKPNSQVITVRSESVEGARARALARAGRGWKISVIQEM